MKRCSKCKKTKVLTDFNNDKRKKDGKSTRCRACDRMRLCDRRNQSYWRDHDPYTQNKVHWLGFKICRLCERRKRLTSFYRASKENDGLHGFCIACVHTYRQERKYGTSICDTDACETCGATGISILCIDHDHTTGNIRGILCHRCNRVLGEITDDTHILVAMLRYLRKPLAD